MSRIEKLGAVVRVLTVNYDDTVIEAQEEAERIAKKNRPVQFIQDTTFENYEVSTYMKEILPIYPYMIISTILVFM